MFSIRTILHPTDFSAYSVRALEVAGELVRLSRATLIVLHVWQEPVFITGGAEPIVGLDLDELRKETRAKLQALKFPSSLQAVERHFVEGDAANEILRAARERASDLIVMGTHGRGGIERFILGSVAEQVMRYATCPVVTVKASK